MKKKNHADENRRPGRIQKSEQPRAGKKLPQHVQILQGLRAGRPRRADAALENRGEHPVLQQSFELDTRAHQHPGAHNLEYTENQQHEAGQNRQHQQGRFATAGKHPVKDLQHVKRNHEHQQIEEKAEYSGRYQCGTTRNKRSTNVHAFCFHTSAPSLVGTRES